MEVESIVDTNGEANMSGAKQQQQQQQQQQIRSTSSSKPVLSPSPLTCLQRPTGNWRTSSATKPRTRLHHYQILGKGSQTFQQHVTRLCGILNQTTVPKQTHKHTHTCNFSDGGNLQEYVVEDDVPIGLERLPEGKPEGITSNSLHHRSQQVLWN